MVSWSIVCNSGNPGLDYFGVGKDDNNVVVVT